MPKPSKTIKRRKFLKTIGVAAASAGSASLISSLGMTGCSSKNGKKPNVILVMTDDRRLRRNRLALLQGISDLLLQVADYSRVVVEG